MSYTLIQAQNDIADLRGAIAHLQENAVLGNATVTTMFSTPDGCVWTTGGLARSSTGVVGEPCISATDTTRFTVSSTSYGAVTKGWSIPANDATVGTLYRLTTWGDATAGTANSTMTVSTMAFGLTAATYAIAGGWFSTTKTFEWVNTALIQCTSVGTSGQIQVWQSGAMSIFGASLNPTLGGNTNQQGSGAFVGGQSPTAVDTTISQTITLKVAWSLTGQQTRGFGSMLERLGS